MNLAEEEGAVDKCIKEYLNFQKLHLCVSAPHWASVNSESIECGLVFIAALHAGSI